MNVLFLTIGQIPNLTDVTVHIDLIKALKEAGHKVSVLCTREKRLGLETQLSNEEGVKILRLKIGNITRCSMIEKGINTLLIEKQFICAIKRYFKNDCYDLVIYNTPPITLAGVVKFCKKLFNCRSYLILKDIFPQNAVDIGLMTKSGLKGLLYKLFRRKEIMLYKQSDKIGCMSKGNEEYLLNNNDFLSKDMVEIFPNAVYQMGNKVKNKDILGKYGIKTDKLTFVYGGNLGKPQGLDFLVSGIKACKDINAHFIIVGSGSEKKRIFELLSDYDNASTLEHLPSDDYMELCSSCDVGIVMLDKKFTIPNYPSRILSYMESSMPVFACTDKVTDIKELVETEAKCGKWCYSGSLEDFVSCIKWFVDNNDKLALMGENGRKYMEQNFNTDICVEKLEKAVREK